MEERRAQYHPPTIEVFVLLRNWELDGTYVVGVYAHQDTAQAEALRLNSDPTRYWRTTYFVQRFALVEE